MDRAVFIIASLALKSGHFWRVARIFLIMPSSCIAETADSAGGVEWVFTMAV